MPKADHDHIIAFLGGTPSEQQIADVWNNPSAFGYVPLSGGSKTPLQDQYLQDLRKDLVATHGSDAANYVVDVVREDLRRLNDLRHDDETALNIFKGEDLKEQIIERALEASALKPGELSPIAVRAYNAALPDYGKYEAMEIAKLIDGDWKFYKSLGLNDSDAVSAILGDVPNLVESATASVATDAYEERSDLFTSYIRSELIPALESTTHALQEGSDPWVDYMLAIEFLEDSMPELELEFNGFFDEKHPEGVMKEEYPADIYRDLIDEFLVQQRPTLSRKITTSATPGSTKTQIGHDLNKLIVAAGKRTRDEEGARSDFRSELKRITDQVFVHQSVEFRHDRAQRSRLAEALRNINNLDQHWEEQWIKNNREAALTGRQPEAPDDFLERVLSPHIQKATGEDFIPGDALLSLDSIGNKKKNRYAAAAQAGVLIDDTGKVIRGPLDYERMKGDAFQSVMGTFGVPRDSEFGQKYWQADNDLDRADALYSGSEYLQNVYGSHDAFKLGVERAREAQPVAWVSGLESDARKVDLAKVETAATAQTWAGLLSTTPEDAQKRLDSYKETHAAPRRTAGQVIGKYQATDQAVIAQEAKVGEDIIQAADEVDEDFYARVNKQRDDTGIEAAIERQDKKRVAAEEAQRLAMSPPAVQRYAAPARRL